MQLDRCVDDPAPSLLDILSTLSHPVRASLALFEELNARYGLEMDFASMEDLIHTHDLVGQATPEEILG